MMYESKFVAAVKSNGKVLREFDKDKVYLKFGSEYSILLKNLENRRAVAKIFIDGQEVSNGGFVIDAKREVEIERFVKDLSQGNRFKFIEKTAGVEAHRGNKIEDGLIRIEFEFERVYVPSWTPDKVYYRGGPTYGGAGGSSGEFYGAVAKGATLDCNLIGTASAQVSNMTLNSVTTKSMLRSPGCDVKMQDTSHVTNDAGITVPGSISDQKFTETYCYTDGIKHTMLFVLLGTADGEPVQSPVTVKAKPKCITCGKVNKAGAKFCSECGTALQIV
jgi:hypothetical protein